MNLQIKQTDNGLQIVSGSDLYHALIPKTEYRHWIKRMLAYGFVDGVDYWEIVNVDFRSNLTETPTPSIVFRSKLSENEKQGKGRPQSEYALTLECAKSIAMVQRSDMGKKVRNYFIEVEKHYKEIATPQQIAELYSRLNVLEQKQINYKDDWTIDRFLRVNGLFALTSLQERQQLGKQCTKAFKALTGNTPKKVQHPSYIGGQNAYPYQMINEVYNNLKSLRA